MLSAKHDTIIDYKAVDASFKFFQHNLSKSTYNQLKIYKNISNKQIILFSHRSFLNTCLRSEIIPKFVENQTKAIDNKTCNYKRQLQFQILENALKNILKTIKKNENLIQTLYGRIVHESNQNFF